MMYSWIIILVIIVIGIFIYAGKNKSYAGKKENPNDILDRRYANGEISQKEYEDQKRIINSKN